LRAPSYVRTDDPREQKFQADIISSFISSIPISVSRSFLVGMKIYTGESAPLATVTFSTYIQSRRELANGQTWLTPYPDNKPERPSLSDDSSLEDRWNAENPESKFMTQQLMALITNETPKR
jgi:hypothetical protein